MANETFMAAIGAGVVGLLVGFVASGTDEEKLGAEIGKQLAANSSEVEPASASQIAELSEQIAAINEKVAGLGDALASGMEQQAAGDTANAEKLDAAVSALDTRIAAVSSEVGELVAASGAEQTAALEAALAGGMADLKGSLDSVAALAATSAGGAEAEEVAQPEPEPEPQIEGVRVGQTELLMDGAVRVFVSGINSDDGTVRVAVNGTAMQTLGSYHTVNFEANEAQCELLLDAVVQGHVQLSASCPE